MEEITSDLKRLIKLQRQRPAFARTISWDFSQSEGAQKKGKSRRKAKGAQQDGANELSLENNVDDDNVDDEGISDSEATTARQQRLSTVESLGDSGSSDESEYYSALEDDIDESLASDDTFETLDSLGESITDSLATTSEKFGDEIDALERQDKDTSVHNRDYSKAGASDTGVRRRRPSKKQKKKKNREFRVTFANEIMCLGNIFDVTEDIDMAVTELTAEDSDICINRQVPSLVQLCMAVTSRKVESKEKAQLPIGMKGLVSGWNKKQGLLRKQLSWLQNRLLPFVDNEKNFPTLCFEIKMKDNKEKNIFIYPTRSVFNAVPSPLKPHWNEDGMYTSGKAASFLVAFSLIHHKQQDSLQWEYNNYCEYQALQPLCIISALASAIDLMLPAFITERSLSGGNVTEHELFSKGFKTMVIRVKIALKARFPRLVEELFDRALPYVMWARGNVAMATEMFNNLISKEKRARHKAMHLSEIARMNCEFDEPQTALKFYRLAAETAVEKPKYTDKDIEEVTEQTQILTASVHDNGLLSPEKARQSSACWNGALNLPRQKLTTAVMAVESFLCYHAAHWTDSSWLDEALMKISNVEKTHQYLKYHASMILALQGKDHESRIKFRDSLNGSSASPGAALLTLLNRKKVKNVWQPLLDIIANNKTPLNPLKVVWRRQFMASALTNNDLKEEAQINAVYSNIRINDDGYLVADIQNILPPQRDICMDLYTGSSIIRHVPSLTAPMMTPDIANMSDCQFSALHMPTPQMLYSDESGASVYLMKPGVEPCARYLTPPPFSPPEPFVIYWQNSEGQKAKINVNSAMKNAMRERCLLEISKRQNWDEYKKTRVTEIMQMFIDNNRAFDVFEVERAYNNIVKEEKRREKKAKQKNKEAPSTKKTATKHVLQNAQPIQVKINAKPRIYGHTVLLQLQDHISADYLMFINTRDKKSFQNFVLKHNSPKERLAEQCSMKRVPQPGEFCILYEKNNANIYNENGTFVERLADVKGMDHPPNPCIVGPNLYLITKDRLSVWKHTIGVTESEDEEERLIERSNSTSWAFTNYWAQLPPTENRHVLCIKVVGKLYGNSGSYLMVHTTVGLCFMDPELLSLIPISVETKSPLSFSMSEDSKLLLCHVSEILLLAEKTYTVEERQITKLAVAVENSILVFEVETSMSHSETKTEIKLLMCVALPGFAVEACFVGKEVGILVAVTMYAKDADFYRQNLFYFKLDGSCYGLLPCLGGRKRSFYPVYLHGNRDEGQSGWHVYMRDGHHGIMCVRLHDTVS